MYDVADAQETQADLDSPAPLIDEAAGARMQQQVQALGLRLASNVRERKTRRRPVEQRWLADLRRYNNTYEPDTLKSIEARKFGSKVFVPLTRRVCNIIEARLSDLLFPTDDRNFVIDASPKPDLVDARTLAKKLPPNQPIDMGGQPVEAQDVAVAVADVIDEARQKAAGMQRTVDDQLKESDYPSVAREVIHDAIVFGTGVVKGPHPLLKTKKSWTMTNGVPTLAIQQDLRPHVMRVDLWNFFPENGVASMDRNGSVFERHELTKLELVRLAGQPGFDVEAIRLIAATPPTDMVDSTMAERQEASGVQGSDIGKYVLYEYHGPVDAEDLRACGCEGVDDELLVMQACVFIDERGTVIKANIDPLDTEETVYSVFNWQKDTASVFGYGIPYELADMQESANGSFRAALDNMGLSVGPMVVVDDQAVVPANGQWCIEPNKLWRKIDRSQQVSQVFGFFQIESRVQELMLVFNACVQMLNEVGGPAMATQGQEQIVSVRTDFQATMAYAAASVWMRRAVKLWDDQVTVPMIRRFMDWNMQFSPDPTIKGDFNAVARGTSALIESEGQAQKVMMLMKASAENGVPIRRVVNQLRVMARSMRLDPEELLPSDDEIAQMEKEKAEQGPPPNPEVERINIRKAELEDNEKERQFKMAITQENNKMRWAEIASRENMTVQAAQERYALKQDELKATIANDELQRRHESQMFNAELVTKARQGSGV